MIEGEALPVRGSNGKFLAGQSGNPSGRPRSESAALRARLEKDVESVAEIVIREALAGDMVAARLVLERVLPPLKATAAPVRMELPGAAGPYPIAEAILRAALTGEIAPDTAAQLVGVAGQLCRIAEVEELRARLDALERATAAAKSNVGRNLQ